MEVPSESRGLRWGICGPGNTAYDFVTAIACLQKGTHVVTAVASRSSREKAEKMAQDREKFGDWIICSSLASLERGIYTQYEQLAADPEVDVRNTNENTGLMSYCISTNLRSRNLSLYHSTMYQRAAGSLRRPTSTKFRFV